MSNEIKGFFKEYRYLSNFHMSSVLYEGILYPSSEHAYQAAKTLNRDKRLEMSRLPTPGLSKKEGSKLELRNDWEEVKYSVMKEILTEKFKDKELSQKLLSTGDCYLEETNNWGDITWGVCNGVGTNLLGKILMEIREKLKKENIME